jgi:hypothetical protein
LYWRLYAKWLFEAVIELNCHPFLRIDTQGWFWPDNWFHWRTVSRLMPAKRCHWQGRRTAIQGLALYALLAPECADTCRHGLIAWMKQGFKHGKRSGWQWLCPRMDDPARAEQLWKRIATVCASTGNNSML